MPSAFPAVKVRKKNETVEIACRTNQRQRWPLNGSVRLSCTPPLNPDERSHQTPERRRIGQCPHPLAPIKLPEIVERTPGVGGYSAAKVRNASSVGSQRRGLPGCLLSNSSWRVGILGAHGFSCPHWTHFELLPTGYIFSCFFNDFGQLDRSEWMRALTNSNSSRSLVRSLVRGGVQLSLTLPV